MEDLRLRDFRDAPRSEAGLKAHLMNMDSKTCNASINKVILKLIQHVPVQWHFYAPATYITPFIKQPTFFKWFSYLNIIYLYRELLREERGRGTQYERWGACGK